MLVLIVHYHLRCGGVTRVIESQVRALSNQGHKVVVASSGPRVDWCEEQIIIPELDYCLESNLSGDDLRDLIPLQPDLWIIHNPTLAKNALFPDFIKNLAGHKAPLLLQCHDFAEDGRPANYQRLSETTHLYPLAENIHYAFVNTRDRSSLIRAGIPGHRCHHLPNAVVPPAAHPAPENPAPLVFCPVRGIRRKNLGELCLLAAHAPAGIRFAIAVAPENTEWSTVHDRWAALAQELALPIEFNVADRLSPTPDADPSFSSWLGHATHLVTTSIAEGFGLTFIEPALLGKPLIGRDLPEITRDFSDTPLGSLYEDIPIDLIALDLDLLKKDYLNQLAATFQSYNRILSDDEQEQNWLNFIATGSLDFGNLPESHQEHLIRNHRLPELEQWLEKSLSIPAQPIATDCWSLDHYGITLQNIIGPVVDSTPGAPDWLPKQNVLAQFISPDRFHFLRT